MFPKQKRLFVLQHEGTHRRRRGSTPSFARFRQKRNARAHLHAGNGGNRDTLTTCANSRVVPKKRVKQKGGLQPMTAHLWYARALAYPAQRYGMFLQDSIAHALAKRKDPETMHITVRSLEREIYMKQPSWLFHGKMKKHS
jgi:hypothetical protein